MRMLLVGGSGGVSGGTIDSLFNRDLPSDQFRMAKHPYCLNPQNKRSTFCWLPCSQLGNWHIDSFFWLTLLADSGAEDHPGAVSSLTHQRVGL